MNLYDILGPQDIKHMNIRELNELAGDIRRFLIRSITAAIDRCTLWLISVADCLAFSLKHANILRSTLSILISPFRKSKTGKQKRTWKYLFSMPIHVPYYFSVLVYYTIKFLVLQEVFLSALRHHLDNLFIRLLHPHGPQTDHVPDRILHSLGKNPFSAAELLPLAVHLVSQDSRVHCGRNLARTGRLGPVADDPGDDRKRVDQGMSNAAEISSLQIGDPAPGSASGADRSAVGRQSPHPGFLMNCNEVGYQQSPV